MNKKGAIVFLYLVATHLQAQEPALAKNAFMCSDIQQTFDVWSILQPGTGFHSSMRPYLSSTYTLAKDSIIPYRAYSFQNNFLSRSFKRAENTPSNSVQLHPIFDLEPGYDALTAKSVFSTFGGAHLKTNFRSNFTFAASVYGGKVSFPFFLDTTVAKQRIIPEYGQGYKSGSKGYSFFDYTGYVSYTTSNRVFNFQAGRDKHFIGDGYRSVLLSDFAAAYPYFRINVNIWRLQYSVWYAWMNDVQQAGGIKQNFTNKYGAFHYLSYNIVKGLNIGLFENVIWRGTDSNQVRTFEVNYLNPLIFYRPQEYSVGSPDNSFIGVNLSATFFKRVKLYGQLGLDEFYLKEIRAGNGWWANKQAWQLGLNYVKAFGVKGLQMRLEYNQARPYTYSHGLPTQNYSHYGVPLAHPLGANFKEVLAFFSYRHGKKGLSAQFMYAQVGKDTSATSSNMGQNIFLSYTTRPNEYGNYTTQGVKTLLFQSHLKYSYYIIPNLNLRLELGYIQRAESNALGYALQNPYIYVGVKSSFWNIYRDF